MNVVVFVLGIKFLATLCSCYVATHKLLVQIFDHFGLLLMCFVYNQFSLRLLVVCVCVCVCVCDIPKTFSGFYNMSKSPC